jgi:hypothetical protein
VVFHVHQIHLLRRILQDNELTGTIPTQVAQLTALRDLYVAIVHVFRVHSDKRAASQVLAPQSPHRTDSSIEFDNCHMVSDAFALHLLDLISSHSNQSIASLNQRYQLPGEPSTFK